jgi:6-phosphofructokinase 1
MKTLAVLTSGGDAPGMNTAIVSATKVATARGWRVVGVQNGYDGLIAGNFQQLGPAEVDDWWQRGGTCLGSARSPAFRTPEGRAEAARNLHGIDALIVIGGNGSLAGAHALSQEQDVPVVGIPASIDNDIACTSTAIGVDTALNTIVEACDRIADTARSHRRVFIVEVMGRECGYLAMAGSIATAADAVIFREQGKSEDQLVAELREVIRRSFSAARDKRRVLIIKAEGVDVPTERLATRLEATVAKDAPGVNIRWSVLGHMVRGGSPSFRDRSIAGRLAFAAVNAVADGHFGTMVGWTDEHGAGRKTADPKVSLHPLETVLAQTVTLLDGTHPTTQRRLRMLEAVQGVLPL